MERSTNQNGFVWYNCGSVDGLLNPVQVDMANVEIASQINQQVHIQYGNFHTIPNPQEIIVTAGSNVVEQDPPLIIPEMVVPVNKPRVRSGNGERVTCPECAKTFSCNANLRDHMRLHTGERPFVCSECGMSFAQRSNWRLHKRVHTGEKPYMCGICGKTFARSSHLPGHMRVHTRERPFECERCKNTFGSQQALKNHMRTHTGEKPYICAFCDTAFTHNSSLSSHKKRCTGDKRKRGRPLGSGRKTYKRKVTGRPRGRPKKKVRTGRPKKKVVTVETEEGSIDYVKPELSGEDTNSIIGFDDRTDGSAIIEVDPLDTSIPSDSLMTENEDLNSEFLMDKKSLTDTDNSNLNTDYPILKESDLNALPVDKKNIEKAFMDINIADQDIKSNITIDDHSVGTPEHNLEPSLLPAIEENIKQEHLHQEAALTMASLQQNNRISLSTQDTVNMLLQRAGNQTQLWYQKM